MTKIKEWRFMNVIYRAMIFITNNLNKMSRVTHCILYTTMNIKHWKFEFDQIYFSNFEKKVQHELQCYLYTYKTLIILIVWLIVCMFEAVRTNPGYGMATLIHNFWDFWELFFVFARKLGWIFMHPKPYRRFWILNII